MLVGEVDNEVDKAPSRSGKVGGVEGVLDVCAEAQNVVARPRRPFGGDPQDTAPVHAEELLAHRGGDGSSAVPGGEVDDGLSARRLSSSNRRQPQNSVSWASGVGPTDLGFQSAGSQP